MKAILLAAGHGQRLRPLTEERPKCMVEVAGEPVLFRDLDFLRAQGIRDVVINLHHRPGTVTSAVGDGSRFGVRVTYSEEPQMLGTAGALRPVSQVFADEPFYVVYADNIIECDLAKLQEAHRRARALMTVALHWRDDVSSSGVATLDAEDLITGFIEKPAGQASSHWVNAGLYLCEPRLLQLLGERTPLDFASDVIPDLLRSGERILGYRMRGHDALLWIDTPADLARAEAALAERDTFRG